MSIKGVLLRFFLLYTVLFIAAGLLSHHFNIRQNAGLNIWDYDDTCLSLHLGLCPMTACELKLSLTGNSVHLARSPFPGTITKASRIAGLCDTDPSTIGIDLLPLIGPYCIFLHKVCFVRTFCLHEERK